MESPTTTFLVQCFAFIIWAIPHFLTTTIPLSFSGSFRPIGSISLSPKLCSRTFGLKLEEISTGNNSSHPSGTSTATFHHATPTFVTHSYCASALIRFRTPAINSTEFEYICGLHHFSPALRHASFNSIMQNKLRPFAATADDLGTNGSRPAGNKAAITMPTPISTTMPPKREGLHLHFLMFISSVADPASLRAKPVCTTPSGANVALPHSSSCSSQSIVGEEYTTPHTRRWLSCTFPPLVGSAEGSILKILST